MASWQAKKRLNHFSILDRANESKIKIAIKMLKTRLFTPQAKGVTLACEYGSIGCV